MIGRNCYIGSGVKLEEWVVVGNDCILEKDATLMRSILWEGAHIQAGIKVVDSIITSGKTITQDLIHAVI
jgi:NDP-sugar pyrophosphorylase family protein